MGECLQGGGGNGAIVRGIGIRVWFSEMVGDIDKGTRGGHKQDGLLLHATIVHFGV